MNSFMVIFFMVIFSLDAATDGLEAMTRRKYSKQFAYKLRLKVKFQTSKIQAIQASNHPANVTNITMFLGYVANPFQVQLTAAAQSGQQCQGFQLACFRIDQSLAVDVATAHKRRVRLESVYHSISMLPMTKS